jgi:hypothetical protein
MAFHFVRDWHQISCTDYITIEESKTVRNAQVLIIEAKEMDAPPGAISSAQI